MPPPPANKSKGRGSSHDGRLTVSDLIQAREAEEAMKDSGAALRKELRGGGASTPLEELCQTPRTYKKSNTKEDYLSLTTILINHQACLKTLSSPL